VGCWATAHTRPRGAARGRGPEAQAVDQVAFVGMRPFVTEEDGHRRGVLSREVVPPRQYDSSVVRKLGDAYPAVRRELEKLAAVVPPDELNARGYPLWEEFAPMVRDERGRESRPRFGQRGVFDPAKVERLVGEATREKNRRAA
jgi:hypothetical protein